MPDNSCAVCGIHRYPCAFPNGYEFPNKPTVQRNERIAPLRFGKIRDLGNPCDKLALHFCNGRDNLKNVRAGEFSIKIT